MPEQIKVEAYKYQELSDKAKEKVQYWLNEYWSFDKWEREEWERDLEETLGYFNIEMQYSGFYSQGDGASITCSVPVMKYIKRNKLGNKYRSLIYWLKKYDEGLFILIGRKNWGHYVHDNLLFADDGNLWEGLGYYIDADKFKEDIEEISSGILEEVKEQSRKLYNWLKEDYEFRFTEEYMIDCCEANEYLFNVSGSPIHHMMIKESEPVTC